MTPEADERLDRIEGKLNELIRKFDQAAEQITSIAEMAGPAIEALTASPVMRMLTGGKRRGES